MKSYDDKLAFKILQLQNLIKRDPTGYYDDFYRQYQHFQPLLEIFKLSPEENNKNFGSLVMFMAHVFSCYKQILKDFPQELMTILTQFNTSLHPEIRLTICKALVLMKNKGHVAQLDLTMTMFELLSCDDKVLRKYIQTFIVADVKKMNLHHSNLKMNSELQNFMYKMLSDKRVKAAKMSLDIMVELYRRNIWKDAKTVNAIATGCFSKVTKILVGALQFFLGADEVKDVDSEEDSESEVELPDMKKLMTSYKNNKKSRRKKKLLIKAKHAFTKKRSKKEVFDFSALHLLHDPQGIAENLLKRYQSLNERFEVKLMVMNFISRLIGVHKLLVLNFYPLLERYLQPRVREVTKILMFAAQASHEQVPPDVMEPIMKTIAYHFISEKNSPELMTVGINSVREICIRCPYAITEDLLQDLVQYKSYKNKNVSSAAKSLIQLYRKVNPKMLQRKYRTAPTEATRELKPAVFGVLDARSYIPGAEVLPTKAEAVEEENDEELSDSDGSWIGISGNNEMDESTVDEIGEDGDPCSSGPGTEKDPAANNILTKTEKLEKAATVSQSRILSQEEFKKVRLAQIVKETQRARGQKRKAPEEENRFKRGELVSLREIEKLYKKTKQTKEERLAISKEDKPEKYGRKRKKNEFSSKTNKEQKKNKAFMMLKHKFKAKIKRSFKDKQIALRDALLKSHMK